LAEDGCDDLRDQHRHREGDHDAGDEFQGPVADDWRNDCLAAVELTRADKRGYQRHDRNFALGMRGSHHEGELGEEPAA
jgi:hypothetical protein